MRAETWLPAAALYDGALTRLVVDSLEGWRRKWICRDGQLHATLGPFSAGAPQHLESGWRTRCGGIAARFDNQRVTRLGAVLLGFRRPPRLRRPQDQKLLEDLSANASQDLLRRMATRFPAATTTERVEVMDETSAGLRFSVTGSYGRLFDIVIATGVAAAARKSLVKPHRLSAPLVTRRLLQDLLEVRLSARVGASEVTATDLKSLAVNDVIILDTKISDLPRLIINGRPVGDGPLSLTRRGAALIVSSTKDKSA